MDAVRPDQMNRKPRQETNGKTNAREGRMARVHKALLLRFAASARSPAQSQKAIARVPKIR